MVLLLNVYGSCMNTLTNQIGSRSGSLVVPWRKLQLKLFIVARVRKHNFFNALTEKRGFLACSYFLVIYRSILNMRSFVHALSHALRFISHMSVADPGFGQGGLIGWGAQL